VIKPMQDDQLIFMISLPRSGSTLLQKILGGHSDIYTRSEPWLMLHPLYALKTEGIQTRYNAKLAADGVQNFLQELPTEDENYYSSRIRDCYLSLYAPYLNASGKGRFLDKTPRYYEIFDELQKTFPRAKFIILYRNPMAVLASMLETWVKGRYEKLKSYKCDLYEGVEFLQRDFTAYTNTHVVRYEELLLNPEAETEALFNFLQLPNQPDCIEYGRQKGERWMYGDPETVYKKSRPDSQHIDAWHRQLAKPEERKLISDYLHGLGETAFARLGYSFKDAAKVIADADQQNGGSPEGGTSLANLLLSDVELIKQVQHSNAKLRNDIAGYKAQLQNMQQQLEGLEAERGSKQARIEELHGEIGTYEAWLSDRDRQIQSRDEQIQARDIQLNERDAQLQERDLQVRYRDEQLKSRDEQLKARDIQVKERDIQLKERDAQLQERDLQVRHRDEQLKSRDEQLKVCVEQIQARDIQLKERDAQLQERDLQVRHRDEQLKSRDEQLKARDEQILARDEQLARRDMAVEARDVLLIEREQKIQASEARLKACDKQIQLLDVQIAERDVELRRGNDDRARLDAELSAFSERLAQSGGELSASRSALVQEQQRVQEFESNLTSVLTATKGLTEHRAYIRPFKKLQAYRGLLSHLNAIRKKHAALLNRLDK